MRSFGWWTRGDHAFGGRASHALVRRLRGEAMQAQRGQRANRAARHSAPCLDKAVVLANLDIWRYVDPLDQTFAAQSVEIIGRDAAPRQVARPD